VSEQSGMLAETARRVFSDCAGKSAKEAWPAIDAAGLALVMVPEAAGGFGGGWEDAQAIFFAAGEHAVSFPICEAIVAAKLLSEAGLAVDGSLSFAFSAEGTLQPSGGTFSGSLKHAAEGTNVTRLVTLVGDSDGAQVIAVAIADAVRGEHRINGADEGRDDLTFENAPAAAAPLPGWNEERLYRALALARASQMAGAIAAALSLSVAHTRQREQFGRPLAAFQAIQQQLAVLAEEAAAARAASAAAARAADRGEASFEIACAKLRANQAAGLAASIAHQVHGAIGFTREYALQTFTRRLWAWRSEYGNERHWSSEIGARAAKSGANGFWPALIDGFAA
jgi:acyl-CoA dehydrogenase